MIAPAAPAGRNRCAMTLAGGFLPFQFEAKGRTGCLTLEDRERHVRWTLSLNACGKMLAGDWKTIWAASN